MVQRLIIYVFFVFCAALTSVHSQIPDPKSIDVNTLSDEQVRRLVSEMEKRGLSESDAIAMAQSRGMNQNQISELRRRIFELKSKGSGSDTESTLSSKKSIKPLSSKADIDQDFFDTSIFGFDFFNNDKLTFDPDVNIPVSDSYVIGGGDEILIDIWGASEKSYKLLVDRNGAVNISQVGLVNVGGLTQQAVRKLLVNKLTSIYQDLNSSNPRTFINVYLGIIKTVSINVIGEVFAPGTYTLPGTASAFNALYLAGGPNVNGSFRNIQVIRGGKVLSTLDVYDYLINGNTTMNLPLRDDDVILVPTYQKRVTVSGEFKRNGIFEVKEKETVADLIKYVGGFTEKAYTQRLELYRNTSKQKKFMDLYDSDYSSTILENGDAINVGILLSRVENRISIRGAIYRPGIYELVDGLTLKQLIDKADGVREDAFLNRGIITRLNPDLSLQNIPFDLSATLRGEFDIKLQREDIVNISSINDLRQNRTVVVLGEVLKPGEIDFVDNMTLSDLIFKTGGFTEAASLSYIEVSRRLSYEESQKIGDEMAHLYQFTISRDLKLSGADAGFELQPFDQVFIRRSPNYETGQVVKISGQVGYVGEYSLATKKERISDLINRAGGLLPMAYAEGAMLTRRSNLSPKVLRMRQELLKKDSTLIFSDLGFDVVTINLKSILASPGGKEDLFLIDGDEIMIPLQQQTVKVSGEVLNSVSATYVEGRRLKYYINQSGGFGFSAKKDKAYVIYPNGSSDVTRGFIFKRYPKVLPGSEVIVPKKRSKEPLSALAWMGIASTMASLTLTLVTVVSVIKN